MSNYRLNRQVVSKSSFKTADDHVSFYATKHPMNDLSTLVLSLIRFLIKNNNKLKDISHLVENTYK